jgi:hypothetical protein
MIISEVKFQQKNIKRIFQNNMDKIVVKIVGNAK